MEYLHNIWFIAVVSLSYLGLLFAVAIYGNRSTETRWQPYVYSLTMAIFCTSWAFYGVVQQSITTGWFLAPTYLGAILLVTVGWKVIDRIITVAKNENSTTISDFIAARFGHSRGIAILVTSFCLIGIIPYIALQLKAVSGSFQMLTNTGAIQLSWYNDPTLIIAAIMAVFAILFGTRTIDSSESNRGMMLAIAFESIIKLVAFMAVGLFAVYGFYDGFYDLFSQAMNSPKLHHTLTDYSNPSVYLTHAVIGAIAIIALPRQFHVAVVENSSDKDLKTARWLFPLYLLLINLFVLPLAMFTMLQQDDFITLNYITLQIPIVYEQKGLALLAYIGGLSAGTSMVIIAAITLATMVSNEIMLPLLIKLKYKQDAHSQRLKVRVLNIRRVAIVIILFMAFFYYRILSQYNSLSEIGLLSFVAVAQFAPAMLIGLVWQGANSRGAYAGLITGFLVWCYCLFIPILASAGWVSSEFMLGPWGIEFLRPYELFGFNGLEHIVHGTFWSLALNTLALIIGSLYYQPGFAEAEQAQRFVKVYKPTHNPSQATYSIKIADLKALLLRFVNETKVEGLLQASSNPLTGRLIEKIPVNDKLLKSADRLLSSVLGRRGSSLLINKLLAGETGQFNQLNTIMEEVSEVVSFNRELLNSVLQNFNQGVSVADENLNLIAWNQKFVSLYEFPSNFLYVGISLEKVILFIAESGGYGTKNIEQLVWRRMSELRSGSPHHSVRQTKEGQYIELQGNAMADNRYVTTYTDITAHRKIEDELRKSNDELEERVETRTQELTELNGALHNANSNKTRFLASAGHDLVQPLNSASLFAASISHKINNLQENNAKDNLLLVAHNLEKSLHSAESLLNELLEISKLDAEIIKPNISVFAIDEVLTTLFQEFLPLAHKKGLKLHFVPCHLSVRSDPALLRRVIQNLLSNALRYTPNGKILLGVRRKQADLWIEVHDTGIGLPIDQTDVIFDEFTRLEDNKHNSEKGLGLGLSIVQRIVNLLGHNISVQSTPGLGSCFRVNVATAKANTAQPIKVEANEKAAPVMTKLILCIDNEQQIVDGMGSLLSDWGYQVVTAINEQQAIQMLAGRIPNMTIIDYHLDAGVTGVGVMGNLQQLWAVNLPCLVITADYTMEVKDEILQHQFYLLKKPVKPMALRSLLRKVMGD
jgi:Na+/proline symporter/signal transduction histidine kinase